MRHDRHRIFVVAMALAVAALSGCSNGKRLSREEARSEIGSAVSLTAESELFVDFVLRGQATRHYTEGQAAYLEDAVNQSLHELEQATTEPSIQNSVVECTMQLKRLDRELSGMRVELDNHSALASARDRMNEIRKALVRARSHL